MKSNKLKLTIVVITLLIICTSIAILKYREYTYTTGTIKTSIAVGKDNINVNCYGIGEPTVIF